MFSQKQEEFIYDTDAFMTVADGAVRSGKTFASLFAFSEFALTRPERDLVILGKTERTIKRNVIAPMIQLFGTKRVRHVQGSGELYLSGRRIYLAGANDERAEEKIRGLTAGGAYCNEMTLYPRSVLDQLIDRCSEQGSRIFGDTNPDSPFHYLNKDFLSNEEALTGGLVQRVRFGLDDNPVLDPAYKERLLKLHTGVWLKRMVHGLWVIAEGAIYDMFEPDGPMVVDVLPAVFEEYRVGIDYGTGNPTVFLLLGKSKGRWYVVREYFYDSREAGRQKTDEEYSRDFADWIGGIYPSSIEVDPSAASFKLQLGRDGAATVRDAENDVLEGVRTVGTALNAEKLYVHRSCERTIESLSTYSWDPKAQKRGEDKPLKENDHPADALRYAVMRIFGGREPTLAFV